MKKEYSKIILIFIVAIFLEVIVFNITSYRTLLGKYETKTYVNPEFLYSNEDDGYSYLKIDNIDSEVVTLKVDFKESREHTNYKVYYIDETSSEYQYLTTKECVSNYKKSEYIPLYLSGNVEKMIIAVDTYIYESGELESISINEKIPFEFNIIRFIVLVLGSFIIYCIKHKKIFDEKYSEKSLNQELILVITLGFFFLLLSFIGNYSSNESDTYFSEGRYSIDSGIYNVDFVNSLKQGRLYLSEQPSEKFLELENPYDFIKRGELIRDIDYKWDTAYYNGHFYIYFGILPVLLIFLPYNLLTNRYLKIGIVVFIFSVFILILLKEILLKLIKRYAKNISFRNVFLLLVILCSGTLILYANGMSRVYELVIIVGLYFVLQGIFFILKSLEKEENRHRNIFFGSLCLALSVACRPTDLLVSIVILPYLINLLVKYIKNIKENKKNLLKLVLAVGVPYLTVGAGLMYYNYIRFGNCFDFGAEYQLTINNMMELGSRIFSVPVGILNNLFKIPHFVSQFPFIAHSNDYTTFYGSYYIENLIGGVFMIAPICFMIFYIVKFNKKTANRELKTIVNSLVIVGIIIASISVAMAGSNQRYLIDYAWMFIFAGILIFTSLYDILKSEESKRILNKILAIITVYTFLVGIASGILTEKENMKNNSPKEYYKTKYTICFWE